VTTAFHFAITTITFLKAPFFSKIVDIFIFETVFSAFHTIFSSLIYKIGIPLNLSKYSILYFCAFRIFFQSQVDVTWEGNFELRRADGHVTTSDLLWFALQIARATQFLADQKVSLRFLSQN
jgi:hypothetical protein